MPLPFQHGLTSFPSGALSSHTGTAFVARFFPALPQVILLPVFLVFRLLWHITRLFYSALPESFLLADERLRHGSCGGHEPSIQLPSPAPFYIRRCILPNVAVGVHLYDPENRENRLLLDEMHLRFDHP